MPMSVQVRSLQASDHDAWLPLWDAYNAFYGREGASALNPLVTKTTWDRFFDPDEPVFGMVAEMDGKLVGMTHFLYHRSTTRLELTCYLQDLFTQMGLRNQGIGRALIEAVCTKAHSEGVRRVYWQTHESNATGRHLYEKVANNHGFIVYARDV